MGGTAVVRTLPIKIFGQERFKIGDCMQIAAYLGCILGFVVTMKERDVFFDNLFGIFSFSVEVK